IAKALGTCGHVHSLRRLYVEPFARQGMETLESIATAVADGRLPNILPADAPLQHLAAVRLDPQTASRVLHGQEVMVGGSDKGRTRIYDARGTFIGIGETDGTGRLRPKRLFNSAMDSD